MTSDSVFCGSCGKCFDDLLARLTEKYPDRDLMNVPVQCPDCKELTSLFTFADLAVRDYQAKLFEEDVRAIRVQRTRELHVPFDSFFSGG